MLSDNETDKITTEEADRSLQIESWKLSKLKIKSIYNAGCNNRDASNEVSEYVCSHFYDFFNKNGLFLTAITVNLPRHEV